MPKTRDAEELEAVEKFWTRFTGAMELWLPGLAGIPQWSAKLGSGGDLDEDDLRNWKRRRPGGAVRPRGKVGQLERAFEAAGIRSLGGDPRALAKHVYSGEGVMPRPGGPVNPDDASDPRGLTVQAASPTRRIVDPAEALEAALAARERGEDVLPILRFAVEAVRQARKLGLAGIVALASVAGAVDQGVMGTTTSAATDTTTPATPWPSLISITDPRWWRSRSRRSLPSRSLVKFRASSSAAS